MIKHSGSAFNLRQIAPLYFLAGQDQYLVNNAAQQIKHAWRQQGECDEQTIHVNNATDWAACFQEAKHYSLFSPFVLLDVRYDKKSLDAASKTTIETYLKNPNSSCLVLIQAINVPAKQLTWIANQKQAILIQSNPLTATALQHWIAGELQRKNIQYEKSIPALIHQYSQHNMLACAQVIEKLSLFNQQELVFTPALVAEHLTDQCDYPLYDLADACLTANTSKIIHLLRQLHQNRIEPIIVLWLISQEIRQLLQLTQLTKQSIGLATACNQLKIWPQRMKLYEMALKRLSMAQLHELLQCCHQLDKQIKSEQSNQIWHKLEQMALVLAGVSGVFLKEKS